MKRYAVFGAVGTLLVGVLFLYTGNTQAESIDAINYKPGLVRDELDSGNTVFVFYASDWCLTCIRQERVISTLRSQNPQYDEEMIFVRVDWNDYRNSEITRLRNIPRRSTLLLLKGEQELGRIVAGTDFSEIKNLLDMGL